MPFKSTVTSGTVSGWAKRLLLSSILFRINLSSSICHKAWYPLQQAVQEFSLERRLLTCLLKIESCSIGHVCNIKVSFPIMMRSGICPVAWAERRQQKHRRWRRKSFRVIVEKVISAKIIVFVYKKGVLYKKLVLDSTSTRTFAIFVSLCAP